ncbi:MAG: putative DNA binding domain-containing protein [candidate division Zixibacteria bacterium]|nr:putative DNA binding domain-containing protein [candidate division Zixibacteria bacterium]
MSEALLAKALAAQRESRQIEFKESLDVASDQAWCEMIKDFIAIANSGGGIILFGLNSRGEPTGNDLTTLRMIDPATITDRIHRYAQTSVPDFEICEAEKAGHTLLGWLIKPSAIPTVFAKPGTFAIEGGKQRTAFGQGTVYFRHGAKSEPGTTEDIASALERKLESIRRDWLAGVRKVVQAPAGSQVSVLPPDVRQSDSPDAAPIKITDDPAAPAYRLVDPDSSHPFRQKEVMSEVRKQLPAGSEFNSYDVVAIRHVHGIDDNLKFSYKPKFASRQYSESFVAWLVSQAQADPEFFKKARVKYRETGANV